MRVEVYDHNNGLGVVPGTISERLIGGLYGSPIVGRGDLPVIRGLVDRTLTELGFSDEVVIDASSGISISGVRGTVGMCFQTGNAARVYADLLKLQCMFKRDMIECGIMITLLNRTARQLGSNLTTWERLTRELAIFHDVVTLPLLALGLGVE
jgi:hypothetical protein